MAKKLTSEEELVRAVRGLAIPEKFQAMALGFMHCYKDALEAAGMSFEPAVGVFRLFFQLVESQVRNPHAFALYHQKLRAPVDYYKFSLDFIRPLIDVERSRLISRETLRNIVSQLKRGENVVFLANHQTESDPLAISVMLEKEYASLGERIIYVAGERVVTDPLAVPFSLGCDLLCIYSKRYIDHPPELKAKKQLHNKNTMELMSKLLEEGGKAIYVAPSGGRDRKDAHGKVLPAHFDPQSVEMFYLMAKKGGTPTHFYPLALSTYDLLPPPETVQRELGEHRLANRTPITVAFGEELDMEALAGSDALPKLERRKHRADAIWHKVVELYKR